MVMIHTLTAYTAEIDDIDAALRDIQGQLDLDNNLLTHAVGLVSCLPAFVETGVIEALAQALPFEVVGSTTIATTVKGTHDASLLTLTVLTSDEVEFVTGHTAPLTAEDEDIIIEGYQGATGARPDAPSLMFAYAPLLMYAGGDFFIEALTKASGGVPTFGMVSVDDTPDYHTSQVIFNGAGSPDQLAFVLLYGAVAPKYYLATISQEKVFKGTGVVTQSAGNQLQTVNDEPVTAFLKELGLTFDASGNLEGINSFPYIVDYNDGTSPVIRAMFATTPEGYAVCGGDIPIGATLSVGYFDDEEILRSTSDKLKEVEIDATMRFAFVFSCVGRYFNLGFAPEREANLVRAKLDATTIPYQFTYAGGEFCPVHSKADTAALTNRSHNCTFVACVI